MKKWKYLRKTLTFPIFYLQQLPTHKQYHIPFLKFLILKFIDTQCLILFTNTTIKNYNTYIEYKNKNKLITELLEKIYFDYNIMLNQILNFLVFLRSNLCMYELIAEYFITLCFKILFITYKYHVKTQK